MIRITNYTLPAAELPRESPLPFFRDLKSDIKVTLGPHALPRDAETLGLENGRRVLPYTLQNRYDRQKKERSFKAAVLENEHLKAVFIPALGGRLVSLYDKSRDRELLHRNPVFQPANLAIRDAWISGGIEWNLGHNGHTVFTCAPLYCARITGAEGEEGLRFYEFERMKEFWWQMDFFLPSDSPFLEATVRIVNEDSRRKNLYWWTNIAVEEAGRGRILAPGSEALHIDNRIDGFDRFTLPSLRTIDGADCTYPANYHFANEFFFELDKGEPPWMAYLEEDGKGFMECSTLELTTRKLFVWGQHRGGQHWQDFLAQPGSRYAEIQAGMAPTQRHVSSINGRSELVFTELFGAIEMNAEQARGTFRSARQACAETVRQLMPQSRIEEIRALRRQTLDRRPEEIIFTGSGWGALEKQRQRSGGTAQFLPGLVFPEETMGAHQKYWLAVLQQEKSEGPVPQPLTDTEISGAWQTGEYWYQMLKEGTENGRFSEWHHFFHLGIMEREHLNSAAAENCFRKSLDKKFHWLSARNLAYLLLERGEKDPALELYSRAWKGVSGDRGDLAVEYLTLLREQKQSAQFTRVLNSLSPEERALDRVRLILAEYYLEQENAEMAEEMLNHEFAVIREGEVSLHELWEKAQILRSQNGQSRRPLPEHLDFGME